MRLIHTIMPSIRMNFHDTRSEAWTKGDCFMMSCSGGSILPPALHSLAKLARSGGDTTKYCAERLLSQAEWSEAESARFHTQFSQVTEWSTMNKKGMDPNQRRGRMIRSRITKVPHTVPASGRMIGNEIRGVMQPRLCGLHAGLKHLISSPKLWQKLDLYLREWSKSSWRDFASQACNTHCISFALWVVVSICCNHGSLEKIMIPRICSNYIHWGLPKPCKTR